MFNLSRVHALNSENLLDLSNNGQLLATVMASPAVSQLPMSQNNLSSAGPHHDDITKSQTSLAQATPSSTINPTSISSSPESRPVDLRTPIPEEEEDETASETANEPITPTDSHHPHDFHHTSHDIHDDSQTAFIPVQSLVQKPPLLVNTAATPPPNSSVVINDQQPLQTPSQTRPTSSREPSIKRGFSQFFRRSNSHMGSSTAMDTTNLMHGGGGSETQLNGRPRATSRRVSATPSPNTTRSNSPPSPGSPGELAIQHQTTAPDPVPSQFFNNGKKNRSSTGLGLRNKLHGITFAAPATKRPQPIRHRATSVDLETGTQMSNKSAHPELTRHPWGFPAEAGTGLKARRMSLNLPDDFTVDVVELHKEFADQSKIIGRRGKTLGKGATSTVRLMVRKGGSSELYAVKEFRGKQSNEKEEDYEKKVKSEYSIAKSLHHPNIVETVRLCTHQNRWNHVMEYCQEGDLFNLVQKGYLTKNDRLSDRLCIFKQLVQGIQYLHSHGIAHRDIKLENILVTSQSKLKITDFGVSEVFSGIHPGLRAAGGQCGKEMKEVRLCAPGICGSMPYIAPEVVIKSGEYDPRPLDVWSTAIVMLHVIFGGALWPRAEAGHKNYDSLLKGYAKWEAKHPDGGCITEGDYPHVVAFDQMVNPPALRRVLVGMLNPDPAKRCTIADVATNRWLRTVECCQVDSYDDPSKTIDASKSKSCFKGSIAKVVHHNHLPAQSHKGHHLIRLPGSTDMDL